MMKDPTEFKQRFKRWQEGEKVYEAGKILPEVVVTADDPIKKLVEDVNARSNADFVNRAKDPNRTWIQDWENKNKIATHKLSWAEDNGKVIVFPEVQNINGKLHDFTNPKYNHGKWDALDSAIERGDTLQMTPEQAKMYTENYKKYYPKGKTFDCGKPLPKYDGGTDDKTYLPEYEYEVTVTPQGTSLQKHKRITNEEDWQKYWGNVGAGYVNKAQESVAKPALEGLKIASYFTPLGNATALGDLLAANINGDKDEVLAGGVGLLPQVRWARNAYKTGKQLMSLNQLWDKHYIRALNDKDLQGVKNLRDAHFIVNAPNTKIRNADLPITLYHGTPNKGWNEYDPKFFGSNTDEGYYGKGLYLTETLDDALAYAGIKDRNFEKFTGTKNPYLKRLYVNSETPFVSGALNNDFKIATSNEASDRAMLAPHFGRDLKFKIGTPGSESGTVYIPNDMIYDPTLVRELENADASIFSNVLHHVDRDPTIVKFDEVVVPKSSQMKYVDPITYDDFGNVIPLSMRDNFSNPDFRFDKGRSIHINPANKGKFNATKKRTGKTTEQLAHSKNPLTRRRAIFALNSRKFKH